MSVLIDSVFACPGTGCSPPPAQEAVLREHCGHARYVWNLAVEQHAHWHPGRERRAGLPGAVPAAHRRRGQSTRGWPSAPTRSSSKPCATSPRPWRRSSTRRTRPAAVVAQSRPATRDSGSSGSAGRQWDVRRVSRHVGQVLGAQSRMGTVPLVPRRARRASKSYRVTMDRAGRWHVAFAVIPDPVPAAANGKANGIDRGVVITAALSDGREAELSRSSPARRERGSASTSAVPRRGTQRTATGEKSEAEYARLARPVEGPRGRPAQGLVQRRPVRNRPVIHVIRFEKLQIMKITRWRKHRTPGPGVRRSGAEPGRSAPRVGPADAARKTRPLAGWRRSRPVHQSALHGPRADRPVLAREPSRFRDRLWFCLPRGRERRDEHRGGARRDCAGGDGDPADEL